MINKFELDTKKEIFISLIIKPIIVAGIILGIISSCTDKRLQEWRVFKEKNECVKEIHGIYTDIISMEVPAYKCKDGKYYYGLWRFDDEY